MALKNAGLPARDYANNRPKIAVKLYEGDLQYNSNGINEEGRTTDMWTVSAPMHNGQYVELHQDSTARHIIVKPAEDNSKAIVGKVIINPKMKWTVDWTEYDKNRLPRANKTWGNYSPRTGTVEFFGDAIDYVDLISANAKIVPFDTVAYESEDKFDKGTNTKTVALAGVSANKGGKLPVLSGFYGYGI